MTQVWKDNRLYRVQHSLARQDTEAGPLDSVVIAGRTDLASVLARSRSASGLEPCRVEYRQGLVALQSSLKSLVSKREKPSTCALLRKPKSHTTNKSTRRYR